MIKHADDCGWHVDQYPWECTCGAIPRKAAMDELIADSADELWAKHEREHLFDRIEALTAENERLWEALGDLIEAVQRRTEDLGGYDGRFGLNKSIVKARAALGESHD